MNLVAHFDEYRKKVREEVFTECVDYAKSIPTARPDDFATAYDFISYALAAAKKAAEDGDRTAYEAHLSQHQLALTALHERMVTEVLGGYEGLTERHLLDFIEKCGWQWFKFCEKSLELKLNIGTDLNPWVRFVPRYASKFASFWNKKGSAVFDSNELALIMAKPRASVPTMHNVLRFKLENPGQKILSITEGVVNYKPVEKLNREGGVDDWSLPLFS